MTVRAFAGDLPIELDASLFIITGILEI